jgi:hypothetical protein
VYIYDVFKGMDKSKKRVFSAKIFEKKGIHSLLDLDKVEKKEREIENI